MLRYSKYILLAIPFLIGLVYIAYNVISKRSIILQFKSVSNSFKMIDSPAQCHWYFLNYTSSSWERMWYDNIDEIQKNVCATLSSPDELNKSLLATQRLVELQEFGRNKVMSEKHTSDHLLSKMYYREECINSQTRTTYIKTDISHLIEPLVGFLRDPFTVCPRINSSFIPSSIYDDATIQSKRFISLSISAPVYMHHIDSNSNVYTYVLYNTIEMNKNVLPWMYERIDPKENTVLNRSPKHLESQRILLDLGSSYFAGWNGDTTAAAGLWFYKYYKRFNVKFNRILAFEHSTLDPKTAWSQIPDDIIPIYTLLNIGVTENGSFNPWRILQDIAQSSDYVVVKIDIDAFALENALVDQILNDFHIYSLIDELFYEHHVHIAEMYGPVKELPGVLKDSYVLFRKFRERGIWLHSWP